MVYFVGEPPDSVHLFENVRILVGSEPIAEGEAVVVGVGSEEFESGGQGFVGGVEERACLVQLDL